jgi:hypothetical protein
LTPEQEQWLDSVTNFGRDELHRSGGFPPYMAIMGEDGTGRIVAPYADGRLPQPADVLELAKKALVQKIREERPQAVGYFYDMILKDTTGVSHRVLAGHLETAGGFAAQFLQIYVIEPGKAVAFGGPRLQTTAGHLFAGTV